MFLSLAQLNTHIENIVEMARGIPNASVINRMYSKLLCSVIESSEAAKSTSTDKMKMIVAIHKTIPSDISYDGLAAALLSMLAKKRLLVEEISDELSSAKPDQASLVKRLRAVIRSLAGEIAFSFDGCALLNALLSLDVNDGIWSTSDEENKARLMFECVLMHAASNGTGSVERQVDLEQALANAKKMLLKWCCTDYGPRFNGRVRRKRKLLDVGNAENGIRIPAPDFQSVLGPSSDERIPTWLNTMRCLLFIEDAGSTLMKHFIAPGAVDDVEWKDEESRIRICCDLSKTLDDEMIWIVLRSCAQAKGGLTSEIAIQLLENLFENCGKGHIHELKVSDPMLVWELYNLVLFDPSGSNATTMLVDSSSRTDTDEAPRLALSHLWWRVTTLALIMCAASTQDIGEVIWSEHPTLQSMIKMVTSNRYRFPTVDCDDRARNEAKVAEQNARDLEALVAERLFLPPKKEIKVSAEKKGSRTSTRLLKKESEAKAAREMAEKKQRKSLLRAAQKSIMIWDPDAPARKPPKEAADLLLSVEHIFKLSEIFQRSVTPDFLLLTLGGTDRGAVERAHEWLIPVISKVPSTISRLPSSASCFLLLRAYGTDGGERAQLKELALPLLGHVSACLLGNLGSSEAVKALDLLLSDMASSKPERRRCSRRVLQDSLASLDTGGNKESWFLKILSLEHAEVVVQNAIRFMVRKS
jgi:integrator complex subunit 1